ncbi:MAG: ABC transporter permease [Lachnospiraceae bacterium]|nr:ABC transporter permease [Lachnospiraceae bacterium]
MKKFLVVLQYEMHGLFTNKGFLITTILFPIIGALLLSLPSIINIPGLSAQKEGQAETQNVTVTDEERSTRIFYDATGKLDIALAQEFMPYADWIVATNEAEVEKAVENQSAEMGFVVSSTTQYQTYLYDKGMFDSVDSTFEYLMIEFYRQQYCIDHGIAYETVAPLLNVQITSQETILHSNAEESYWYSYLLTIIVFMIIILYGQMIATAVASEKSNRAMEVLVTSTTPNTLLFGKVIANALAGLIQVGLAMGAILISYRLNRVNWANGALDSFLSVPTDVLIVFAVFGVSGYLFYAFLFGALGALVSKTEDVSKAMSGPMMIIMIVYFFSLVQLTSVSGIIMKVLSFLPISSYGTMFIRVGMHTADTWEVIVSLLITILSTVGVGILAARIYRLGTLRYGNPIKLSTALKGIRKGDS